MDLARVFFWENRLVPRASVRGHCVKLLGLGTRKRGWGGLFQHTRARLWKVGDVGREKNPYLVSQPRRFCALERPFFARKETGRSKR